MSGSLHIYAEPDELVADGPTTPADDDEPCHQQHHQLDPAHITIDVVLQRGIELKPNSITLTSSELAPNMFESGSCQIPLH